MTTRQINALIKKEFFKKNKDLKNNLKFSNKVLKNNIEDLGTQLNQIKVTTLSTCEIGVKINYIVECEFVQGCDIIDLPNRFYFTQLN